MMAWTEENTIRDLGCGVEVVEKRGISENGVCPVVCRAVVNDGKEISMENRCIMGKETAISFGEGFREAKELYGSCD